MHGRNCHSALLGPLHKCLWLSKGHFKRFLVQLIVNRDRGSHGGLLHQ